MSDRRSRVGALAVVFAAIAVALAGGWLVTGAISLPAGPDDYNVVEWEIRNFPNKWLYDVGTFFRGQPDEAQKTLDLERFLSLSAEIASLESQAQQISWADSPIFDELAARRRERDKLENVVEATLEERVARVVEQVGLESSVPLFPGVRWLFPPVDFEFADPPRVLAISPLDRIYLQSTRLLKSDLTLQQIEDIERREEAKGVSALVAGIGGVGTYPAAVPPEGDYADLAETIAHEWMHNYLFFRPLGSRYFLSPTLATINETVADIAGQELGAMIVKLYPVSISPPPQAPNATPAPTPDPSVDFNQVMRDLRSAVDRLLSEGKITDAESLMEQRRQFLANQGYYIRRINQAYFAFHGLYADTPASSSPIGPKLQQLRQRSASLGAFIHAAASITSEADLDRLLAAG